MLNIKTASDLKRIHEHLNPESHFFTRSSMKFFGDKMRNYGVRFLQEHNCFELYRRKPVKHNLTSSAYFDSVTCERIHQITPKETPSCSN